MKKHDIILCYIFVVIMSLLGGYWVISNTSWTVLGTMASIACFILFVLLGIRTIPMLTDFIAGSPLSERNAESIDRDRRRSWLNIALMLLVSRILLMFIAYAFLIIQNGYSAGLFSKMAETWHISGIDASAYLGIAENGYVTEGDARFHIVFFPFFPNLVRVVHGFVGSYFVAGFVVSNIFTLVAAIVAYELAALDMHRKNAMRVVKYIFIFPAAFFFFIPMTESLFLALSLLCIYFVRKKEWFIGCLCGALAAYTRSPGVLLIVPVAIEFARELIESYKLLNKKAFIHRLITAISCLVILSIGLVVYLYINYYVTGNAFQFSIYQREHWSQQFYLFFDTVRNQMEYAIGSFKSGDSRSFLGLWLPNLVAIFSAIIMMVMSARKLRPSYTAYFIVYFAFVVGATWLLSAPRYLLVAFPLAFAAVTLTEDKSKDAALTVTFVGCSLLYLAAFVAGYPVY